MDAGQKLQVAMKAMRSVSVIVEKKEFAGFARKYFSRSATYALAVFKQRCSRG